MYKKEWLYMLTVILYRTSKNYLLKVVYLILSITSFFSSLNNFSKSLENCQKPIKNGQIFRKWHCY